VSDHAVIDRDLETMHVFTAVDINAKHQAPSTKHANAFFVLWSASFAFCAGVYLVK
jgi:hypothetical protein